MVAQACNTSYVGDIGRMIMVQGQPQSKTAYLKDNYKKEGLGIWHKL
jgi:hypothetical protein